MSDQHINEAPEKHEPIVTPTSGATAADAQKTQERILAVIRSAPIPKAPRKSSIPSFSRAAIPAELARMHAPMAHSRFHERWGDSPSKPSPGQIFSDADKISTESIKWVIQDWLPEGELTLLVGAQNVGKNTMAGTFAAGVTQGKDFSFWPNARPSGYGVAIISSTEERFASVSKPKFVAAGGKITRFKKFNGIPSAHSAIPFITRPCNFSESDNAIWLREAGKIENLGLIIFDPASQVTCGNSNNAKDREGHEKLARFAKELNCAVVGIAHTSKVTKGKNISARIAGTGAVAQVARSIIMISKIKSNATQDGATHIMVLAKAYGEPINYGVSFRIVGCEITDENGQAIKTSKIVWYATIPGTPEELLEWADGSSEMAMAGKIDPLAAAVGCIQRILRNGPLPSKEAEKLVAREGITTRIRDQAKMKLGVISRKGEGQGQNSSFFWRLPETETGNT